VTEKTVLIRLALTSMIQKEAARRLAALGGSSPDMTDIPRRRME
jgi:hypothetical protein